MHSESFEIADKQKLKNQILHYLKQFDTFCYLDSCDFYQMQDQQKPLYNTYDMLAGIGSDAALQCKTGNAFEQLKHFQEKQQDWIFGYFTYDLKNEIERLGSNNPDHLRFPDLHFFKPRVVLALKDYTLTIHADQIESIEQTKSTLFDQPEDFPHVDLSISGTLKNQLSRDEYIAKVNKTIDHIEAGDVYEMNFCQEFYHENAEIDPYQLYYNLKHRFPTPFSSFYRNQDHFVISASLERFIKKTGGKLISQPIKGTIKRGETAQEDASLKEQLQNDPKERAENVMIVDLVRNDLAKSSYPGTVNVEELFGIYTFPNVHQMISTVTSQKRQDTHFIDAIKNAFPMGSMTGAPKVKAMELIEHYENFKRGVFSGSIGYISPGGDFDFNVIIRTFLYNQRQKYLSIPVGSAITYDAIAEKEFEECLVKISSLTRALNQEEPFIKTSSG